MQWDVVNLDVPVSLSAPADMAVDLRSLLPATSPRSSSPERPPPTMPRASVAITRGSDGQLTVTDGEIPTRAPTPGDAVDLAVLAVAHRSVDVAETRSTVLHAAGLVAGGQSVLLLGGSWSGKSTLAAAAAEAGAGLLGDDALLLADDVRPVASSMPVKLRSASRELLGPLRRAVVAVAGGSSGQLYARWPEAGSPPPVGRFVVLRRDAAPETAGTAALTALRPSEVLEMLVRSTFGFAERSTELIRPLMALADGVPGWALHYSELAAAVDLLV